MQLREITNDEFTNFFNNFDDRSIYQTKEYAFAIGKQNFETLFVGLIDDNKIVAASLIIIEKNPGFKYAYAPRGFLIDYTDNILLEIFTNLLKKFLSKKDVAAIKISPYVIKYIYKKNNTLKNNKYDLIFNNLINCSYFHMGYNNFFEALKPRFEATIEINKPINEIFNNISKNYRTKIRSAEANGINIHRGKKEDLKLLYKQTQNKYPRDLKYFEDCYDSFSRNNNIDFFYAKIDTKEYLEKKKKEYEKQIKLQDEINAKIIKNPNLINKKINIDKEVGNKKDQLVKATNYLRDYPNGIITASALIAKTKDEVFLLIDGHDKKYKTLNSKHLIIWKTLEKYSKEGYKKFNFGGISNPNIKDNKYEGLNNFKLNFGSDIYEFIGDFELIINNTKYFMYKNVFSLKSILKK